jgi:pyrimidine-nucleoside phosphorylase
MLALGGLARDETQGKKMAEEALDSGKALLRFRDLVRAQGGDVRYVDEPSRFPNAKWIRGVRSPQSGYLTEINARDAGETSVLLGGGRAQKGDPIDYTVGLVLERKVGDPVKAGDLLFTVHANDEEKMEEAIHNMLNAHQWSDEPVKPLPLYYGMIS